MPKRTRKAAQAAAVPAGTSPGGPGQAWSDDAVAQFLDVLARMIARGHLRALAAAEDQKSNSPSDKKETK